MLGLQVVHVAAIVLQYPVPYLLPPTYSSTRYPPLKHSLKNSRPGALGSRANPNVDSAEPYLSKLLNRGYFLKRHSFGTFHSLLAHQALADEAILPG